MADEYTRQFLYVGGINKYWDSFKEKNINRERLKTMNSGTLKDLIPEEDDQIKFKNQWKAVFHSDFDGVHDAINVEESETLNKYAIKSIQLCFITKDRMMNWIQVHPVGRSILQSYNSERPLTEKQANDISEVVFRAMQKKSRKWEQDHLFAAVEVLAGDNGIFRGESIDRYFSKAVYGKDKNGLQVLLKAAGGKLYNKFKNKGTSVRENLGIVKRRKLNDKIPELPQVTDEPEAVQASIEWLESNELPLEDLKKNWKITSACRHQSIRKDEKKTTKLVFNKWIALKNPQVAADLISLDFDQNFTVKRSSAMEKFSDSFFKIIKQAQKKRIDSYVNGLEDIAELDYFSTDHRVLAQLTLLAYYYPPTATTFSSGKCTRFSSADAEESIIRYVDVPKEIENLRDEVAKKHKMDPIQPYIIGVGLALGYSRSYFVVINDELLLEKSAAAAIDLCFKAFHVLHLKYPRASEHVWRLIEEGLYGLERDPNECSPQSMPKLANILEILKEQFP